MSKHLARLGEPGLYIPGRAFLSALYLFAFSGGAAALAPLLSNGTSYGLGYSVWFGGLVVVALAAVLAPIVGARVGGLDYDLGTVRDLHLAGRRVRSLHMLALGKAAVLGFVLVLAGLLSALVVSAVARLGGSWSSGAVELVSSGMVLRLVLACVIGLPFAALLGWTAAVLLRSGFLGALVVEASLVIYILGVRLMSYSEQMPLRQVFRFSPWGAFLAMSVGDYRYPSLVPEPIMSLPRSLLLVLCWAAGLVLMVWLTHAKRDIAGGGAS